VTTQGSTDTANGRHAEAVFNGSGNFTGGGTATLTNLTIKTSGDGSSGVVTEDGGATTLNGGSINTTGNAAYAVSTNTGGLVSLNGTTIGTTGNGSGGLGINGGEIDATNVTIATTGAFDPVSGQHSYGVYNGPFQSFTSGGVAKLTDVSVSTQGVDMHGVLTNTGGATTILGGSIATSGAGAHAILAENGGAVTVGVSPSGSTTISTTGTSAPDGTSAAAVVAYNGGVVQLTGATVTTGGAGSTGLVVHGATSSLSTSGVSVTTSGAIDPATGDHADGAFNGPYFPGGLTSGGLMSLTNSTIATSGAGANGVETGAGGTTTISGGSVMTTGLETQGVSIGNGGNVTISGGSVTTSGNGSQAIEIYGAGAAQGDRRRRDDERDDRPEHRPLCRGPLPQRRRDRDLFRRLDHYQGREQHRRRLGILCGGRDQRHAVGHVGSDHRPRINRHERERRQRIHNGRRDQHYNPGQRQSEQRQFCARRLQRRQPGLGDSRWRLSYADQYDDLDERS
jgi:hypothetical protein